VPKLSQSHLFQRQDDTALPVPRQRLPNRRRRTFAHRAIQTNAPGHSAHEIRPSVIRRISSTFQRHCQWYIERFFSKLKHFRRVATRYDKLAANFLAMVQLASMRLWMRANEPTG
jgi:transposase